MPNNEIQPQLITEQSRGVITIDTVAYNLWQHRIFDWEDAFRLSSQRIVFKHPIGAVRLELLRSYKAELEEHKRRFADAKEHLITDEPKPKGEINPIIVDGKRVLFISRETEFMVREMLDGSAMSKENYADHMRQQIGAKNPQGIIQGSIDHLNKYFLLGAELKEHKVNGRDMYSLEVPKTTKVRFGGTV